MAKSTARAAITELRLKVSMENLLESIGWIAWKHLEQCFQPPSSSRTLFDPDRFHSNCFA